MPAGRIVTPTKMRGGRGGMMPQVRGGQVRPAMRAGLQMMPGRGGVQMMRGAPIIQRPRMAQPVAVPQSRRGRPAQSSMVMSQNSVSPQFTNNKRTIIQNQRKPAAQPRSVSPTPSWHTPSSNQPVSPPRLDGANFKIKLPMMRSSASISQGSDDDDDIISLDPPPPKVSKVNGTFNDAIASLQRTGVQVGTPAQEEGVDPLSLDEVSYQGQEEGF